MSRSSPGKITRRPGTGLYDIPLPKSFSPNSRSASPKAQRKTSSPKASQGLYNIPLSRSSSPRGAIVQNPYNVPLPRSSSLSKSSPKPQSTGQGSYNISVPRTVSPKSKSPKRSSPKRSSPRPSPGATARSPMSPGFKPKSKRIFFVHFQFEGQKDFYVDDATYCDGVMPFPYIIVYDTFKLPFNVERLKELSGMLKSLLYFQSNIAQVLMYIDFRIYKDLAQLMTQQEKFFILLKYFKQSIGTLNKHFSVFVHFDAPIEKCIFSRQKLYEEQLEFNKFLIIYTTDTKKFNNRFRTLFESADSSQYDIREFPASQAADDVLKCQRWFEYFVDYMFGCLKGRLKQISGTCYLNAAVNGFVLTPAARKIALLTLLANKAVDFDYKSPLNLGVCDPKTEHYFYRLMYNVVCSGFPLSDLSGLTDIMMEYSKIYSANPETGHGGWGISALIGIFRILNQDFTEIIIDSDYTGEKEMIYRPGTGDFLLYNLMSGDINVPGVKVYNGEDYLIQFAIITIFFEALDSHEVCGYICDGVYKVFDSNGFYFNINWRRATELRKMKIGVEQNYGKKVDDIRVKCVFIKKSTIQALEPYSTDNICASL